MTPKSTASTATSIDTKQRQLTVGIAIATLMALAIVIADLARGGRPDPPALRAAATLLDGAWRFHTEADPRRAGARTADTGGGEGAGRLHTEEGPRWADANTDDSGWETIDLTAWPGSHDGDVGLPDYVG